LELISSTEEVFRRLMADIDAAGHSCHLEFYIWNEGGLADEVAEALLRAAARGVICRVLVDAVGSRSFLRGRLAARLRQGGVAVQAALPGGLLHSLFVRFDLRLHRKIVVVDGRIGYTGSLNLVDPRFFKQSAGVGQWVDAMVRVEGPAVEGLAVTFLEDWELETGEGLKRLAETSDVGPQPQRGLAAVQVIPSGPLVQNEAMQQILLTVIYAARRELVLTTPYFVPDEPLLTALTSAARRGVAVTIVLPKKVDSLLVRLASWAQAGDLMMAGVRVVLFHDGLLHTKSITVDGEFGTFGSLNLDPRSLYLNFEITLAIYDRQFIAELRRLQQSYIDRSETMDLAAWQSRSGGVRLVENAIRLLGPLL
jgi:cardiolipin synthase